MVHMTPNLCRVCGAYVPGHRKNPRCLSCYNKDRPKGTSHPRWSGTSVCPKCGGTKSGLHAKSCRKCWEHKGEKHYNYGKHLSEATRMKISIGNMGQRTGESNHRWNPDKLARRTYRLPHRLWREKVLNRDGNACLVCGSVEAINVHHIDPYKDSPDNLMVENGITLCGVHHKETFGKEHQFREQFEVLVKKRVNSGEAREGLS